MAAGSSVSRSAAWALAGAALLTLWGPTRGCRAWEPLSAASLFAETVQPPNPNDLTQGTWELNVQKTKLCPASDGKPRMARPGGRIIQDVGFGMIAVQWIDTNDKGERYGAEYPSYVYRYDGDKYPAGKYYNRPSSEGIAWKLVNPNRVEFEHWSTDGKITSNYVRTVSADGQEMIQTMRAPGQTCVESQVFDRKPDVARGRQ